jgi:small ligand-binding sensory domain FIST
MSAFGTAAHAALAVGVDWEMGLAAILPDLAAVCPDLVFCFGAHHLAEAFPEIMARVQAETGARALIGCSTSTVISNDRELERVPALSLLALALPGATLTSVRFSPETIAAGRDDERWRDALDVSLGQGRGWFVFGDPFNCDGEALLKQLRHAFPGAPVIGGMAGPGPRDRQTWLFHNDEAISGGAVGLALGGDYDLIPLVSQGCEPIGQTWTITAVNNSWIETIGNRPAIQVLIETLNGLDVDLRPRARRNLLVGVAADEYRPNFQRGDFLIRAVTGFDQARGAIAVEGGGRVGQTMQFQMRDAATADLDLRLTLDHAAVWLDGRKPVGGVLCACQSRGAGLFGASHHDAGVIAKALGSPMIAGCYSSAEIGPVGLIPFIHGQSAVLGLICRQRRQ